MLRVIVAVSTDEIPGPTKPSRSARAADKSGRCSNPPSSRGSRSDRCSSARACITSVQLEEALLLQQGTGRRLGELLIDWGWVSSRAICIALAEQYELEYVEIEEVELDRKVATRLPKQLARAHQALTAPPAPRRPPAGVGVADPTDVGAAERAPQRARRAIRLAVVDQIGLERAIHGTYAARGVVRPRPRPHSAVSICARCSLPGVVDVDRLPLGEDVERRLARLAVAVAGLLGAAEREVHLGAGRAGVDVGDPGLRGRASRGRPG